MRSRARRGSPSMDELQTSPSGYKRPPLHTQFKPGQMLLTRMSPEGARLYGTTNPDSPYHWLKTDYLDNHDLRAKNLLWSAHFTMADNPNLTPEFVEAQHRLYRGFFHQRFIQGRWVLAEGVIYKDSWSEDVLYDVQDEPIGLRARGGHQQRIIAIAYGT